MWRDILLALGVIVAVLAWWGVPPKYVGQLIKRHITLNRLIVSLVVILTGVGIYTFFFYRRPIDWGIVAGILYLYVIIWRPIIDYYFSSRGALRKVISLIARFGPIPTVVVMFITWDAPVWRKVVPILVGFVLGIATRHIENYIRRRRAIRRENINKT